MESKKPKSKFKMPRKYSHLIGDTVVDYETEGGFIVRAGPGGVSFQGEFILNSMDDLDDFAKVLSNAWKSHQSLKPKVESLL